MQPIKQYQSQFIERWSRAEYINAKLGVTIMVLSSVCMVLAGFLVQAVIKPKPIYYIPSMTEAGIAYPNQMHESAVLLFTASWVLNWSNFTPATVIDVYERSQRFMSPGLLTKTQGRLAKDLDDVKRNNISSLFTIKEDPKVEKNGRSYLVTLKGEKGLLMGKETVSVQMMTFKVLVRSVPPTDINPHGLMIDDIDQEIIRD